MFLDPELELRQPESQEAGLGREEGSLGAEAQDPVPCPEGPAR